MLFSNSVAFIPRQDILDTLCEFIFSSSVVRHLTYVIIFKYVNGIQFQCC